MRVRLLLLMMMVASMAAGCASMQPKRPEAAGASLDSEIRRLMAEHEVVGLALAVVRSGEVTQVETFGYRNLERGLPLTPETVLYGASLTKAAFGYMVLQLVDEGRLSLDTSIAALLPRPLPEYEDYGDIAGDDRWKALTPRILLTHSSGLANFRWLEEDGRLQFHFEPGTRYGYSGEGFYILQLVLEQGLGLDVGLEMQRRVFDRFAMSSTSMTWRPAFAENLADGYGTDGTMEPHDERSSVSAAGSMDTTIADQAKLWAGIVRGEGLSPASRAERVRPGLAITSLHQFPTLRPWSDPRNAEIGLSAGLGVVVFKDTSGPAWFKGGHNDWTGNMVVCLEASQDCVVMMANDVRAERIFPEVARLVLGETRMPWRWEYDWFESSVPGRAR